MNDKQNNSDINALIPLEEKIKKQIAEDIAKATEGFQKSAEFAELMAGNLDPSVMRANYADAMDMTIAMKLSATGSPEERYTLFINRMVVLNELATYLLYQKEKEQPKKAE